MKKAFTAVLFAVLLIAAFAESGDYFNLLDKLLIESSYKMKVEYGEIGEKIIILDGEYLKDLSVKNVKDLLAFVSEVFLSRYRSGEVLVFSRGILASHNERFLLLINGVSYADPFYNQSYVDEYMPLVNIERVEVALGGYSSLYGTGAFAGYINVVEKETYKNEIMTTASSDGYFGLDVSFGENTGKFSFGGSATKIDMFGTGVDKNYSGLPVTTNNDPKSNLFLKGYLKYGNLHFSMRTIDYQFCELNNAIYSWDQVLQSRIFDHHFEDTFIRAGYESDLGGNILSIDVNYQVFDRKSVWGYTVYDSTDTLDKTYECLVDAVKYSEKIFGEATIKKEAGKLRYVAGVMAEYINLKDIKDYIYENNSSVPLPDEDEDSYYLIPTKYNNYAAFGELIIKPVENVKVSSSVRYDYNHFFKGFLAPKFVADIKLRPVSLNFTYNLAFRAPTPRELLILTGAWAEGNPDLEPEELHAFNAGLKYTPGPFSLRVNVFYEELKNIIEKISGKYENVEKGLIVRGVTASAGYNVGKFLLQVNGTYQRAVLLDLVQANYPDYKITVMADYMISENARVFLNNEFVGRIGRSEWADQYGLDKNDGDPYALTSVYFSYTKWGYRLNLFLKNMFDTPYYTMYYIDKISSASYTNDLKMPGRTFGVSVSYEF